MRITLRQIEIFLKVVELEFLTKVGKELGLSQSAVSMSLKELENILGKKLFDRINKRLVLNEIGRSFYQTVQPIYKKLRDIESEFKNSEDKGSIRVGASTTIIDYLMPTIVCDYMSKYPNVQIGLKEGNTKDIVELVKGGKIDIGFIEGNVEDSEIIKEAIGEDELVIITANEELKDKKVTLEEIADYKWVLREEGSGTRETFLNYIKDSGVKLNVFLELGHTESIKSLLLSKKPLSCISILAVADEIENKRLFKVDVKDFKCTRNFYAIYHKDKYKSELFNKLYEFSKNMISKAMIDKGCISGNCK
jgi:DNA-binding transcriptional LysR family regulator